MAQAFKETLTAAEVAAGFRSGIAAAGARAEVLLGSDGGDGLLEALRSRCRRVSSQSTTGPLGGPVAVEVGWLDDGTVLVESRQVCGLALVPPDRRSPGRATTRGLGTLLDELGGAGVETAYVGLGGSATMDGGLGMARAWGWQALDAGGDPVPEGGAGLERIDRVIGGAAPRVALIGLADVRHPLLGPHGAQRFARQKGADAAEAERLARGLERLVRACAEWNGETCAGVEGAGAAGGLGFGLQVFGGGMLERGARWVLDRVGFHEALSRAALVLVGEGAFDDTSREGKLTGEVLAAASRAGIPGGLVAPHAERVPTGVAVETGPGTWNADDLSRHATRLVRRMLRLPRG